MATKISNFISQIGQGVKPNMFYVEIPFPTASSGLKQGTISADDQGLVNLLCKSAALPASQLGVIEVPFRGRTVKIAGDRTFDSISFYATGKTGATTAYVFDGGYPWTDYTVGPAFNCGGVV